MDERTCRCYGTSRDEFPRARVSTRRSIGLSSAAYKFDEREGCTIAPELTSVDRACCCGQRREDLPVRRKRDDEFVNAFFWRRVRV